MSERSGWVDIEHWLTHLYDAIMEHVPVYRANKALLALQQIALALGYDAKLVEVRARDVLDWLAKHGMKAD